MEKMQKSERKKEKMSQKLFITAFLCLFVILSSFSSALTGKKEISEQNKAYFTAKPLIYFVTANKLAMAERLKRLEQAISVINERMRAELERSASEQSLTPKAVNRKKNSTVSPYDIMVRRKKSPQADQLVIFQVIQEDERGNSQKSDLKSISDEIELLMENEKNKENQILDENKSLIPTMMAEQ